MDSSGRADAAEVNAAVSWLKGHGVYHKQIAHKPQHEGTGYRDKITVVFVKIAPEKRPTLAMKTAIAKQENLY